LGRLVRGRCLELQRQYRLSSALLTLETATFFDLANRAASALRACRRADVDPIIVDWMRRQRSCARVDIASLVLQGRWCASTSIAPASVEAMLEALRSPLAS
jgi:hypothetical protein